MKRCEILYSREILWRNPKCADGILELSEASLFGMCAKGETSSN
jgi:hypothetical protein